MESPSFNQTFLQRLESGDDDAMQKLFERYSQALARVASHNIHPALIKRFDGEDVVQSVFRTFFRRQDAGNLSIAHTEQLWKLLVTITLCKTRNQARKHTADKRDVRSEQESAAHEFFPRHQPAPEDALMFWEEVDWLLQGLPDRVGEILSARLEGKTKTEIADQLEVSRQTVHRTLNLLQDRLNDRMERLSVDSQ